MKRFLTAFLAVFSLLAFVCLGFSGCVRDKEDCIPDKLGETEGYYVYYNNYRCLTDGTQTEKLLSGITVDGVEYTDEEFEIWDWAYMTSRKEIIYFLATNKEGEDRKYFLWHYNYDIKESGLLYTFEQGMSLVLSEKYCFVYDYDNGERKDGILFDWNFNVVEEDLDGYYLRGEILYGYNYGESTLFWWKDGNYFSVQVEGRLFYENVLFWGDYVYLFPEQGTDKVYAVDLNTGEATIHTFENGEKFLDCTGDRGAVTKGDNVYFITYTTETPTEYEIFPLEAGCALWALNGTELKHVYTFSEKYEVTFASYSNEENINFNMEYIINKKGQTDYIFAYYNLNKNKFVKDFYGQYEYPDEPRLKVGEYEYYVDTKSYGGLMNSKRCFYLHRVNGSKDEILYYYFDEKDGTLNPLEYNDIHTR